MKKVFLFLVSLGATGFSHPMSCKEVCQYWDDFDKVCHFPTRCEVTPHMARYTTCERFDTFEKVCLSEATEVVPIHLNYHVPPPPCTEKCQHYDNFTGKCLYKTHCEYYSGILKFTSCGKWDDFDQRCYYESHSYAWNNF